MINKLFLFAILFLSLSFVLLFSGCVTNLQDLNQDNFGDVNNNVNNNVNNQKSDFLSAQITVYIDNLNSSCKNDNLVVLKDRQGNIIAQARANTTAGDYQSVIFDINSDMPEFSVSTDTYWFVNHNKATDEEFYMELGKYNNNVVLFFSNGSYSELKNPIILELNKTYINDCKFEVPNINENTPRCVFGGDFQGNIDVLLRQSKDNSYFDTQKRTIQLKDKLGNILDSKETVTGRATFNIKGSYPEFNASTTDGLYLSNYYKIAKCDNVISIEYSGGSLPLDNPEYALNLFKNSLEGNETLSSFLQVNFFDGSKNLNINGTFSLKNKNGNAIFLSKRLDNGKAIFNIDTTMNEIVLVPPSDIYKGPDKIVYSNKNGKSSFVSWEDGSYSYVQAIDGTYNLNYYVNWDKTYGYILVSLYDTGKMIPITEPLFELYGYDDIYNDYSINLSYAYTTEIKEGKQYFKIDRFGKFKILPKDKSKYNCQDIVYEEYINNLGNLELRFTSKEGASMIFSRDKNYFFKEFNCGVN